jgi:hypothetical protein
MFTIAGVTLIRSSSSGTITSIQCRIIFYHTPCVFQQLTNYEESVSYWHPIAQGEKRFFKLLCVEPLHLSMLDEKLSITARDINRVLLLILCRQHSRRTWISASLLRFMNILWRLRLIKRSKCMRN